MLEKKQRISSKKRYRAEDSVPAPIGGVAVPLFILLVLISCVAVVQSSHKSRKLFGQLQDLRREAMVLEEDWGRLLLEQSTWASPDRVQDLAVQKLKMQAPKAREVKMVGGYGKAG
ncbi:Cell division protein FtsL [Zhongshania aliphaticivorans]|uniref:Cell division protein FtsL n=1 Tax=Zhongshania aliphaticivorans TaxID=1470434 RepID=A0A5S9N2X1_9GAMM|nr:cell division protein FtsL [Zhongshania aliphaticivorans]CAA0083181.1 Cell division protein FtsL [Zhongshania aliphaticivorans]CAA0083579.1 Cell division protein FtsL [Zhongshania aliphaticivorans]